MRHDPLNPLLVTPWTQAPPVARWVSTALLVLIAVTFSSNHVAARLAFDHGVSVVTAVTVRSAATALVVFVLLRLGGLPVTVPRPTLLRAIALGVMLSVQSYCLYGAVARLPVALALLTFNTFPIVLALMSWGLTGERPAPRTLFAMPLILSGLVLALDVVGILAQLRADPASPGGGLDPRVLSGIAHGLGASLAFAGVLYLTPRWLGAIDGRLRSMLTMAVVAMITACAALLTDGFALPRDAAGWTGLALLTVFYGAAITALFTLLPRIGAVNNSPVMNIEPISAMLLAWLVLDQRFEPLQIAGALTVVATIIFVLGRAGR